MYKRYGTPPEGSTVFVKGHVYKGIKRKDARLLNGQVN